MTKMMRRYLLKFFIRLGIFGAIFSIYIYDKQHLRELVVQPISMGICFMHVVWLIFMVMMLRHLFPGEMVTMALKKLKAKPKPAQEVGMELEMYRFIQDQNKKAWMVMLVWLIANSMWGLLYLFHVVDETDLVMLSVFYFVCDYICILFFCPFQTVIMKNKCCVNCRIFDWGHFMMFTPMLFIRNFFSCSLFFTSCVVLIHWEIKYIKYPEKFWENTNENLKCENCKDRTCKMKKKITSKITRGTI